MKPHSEHVAALLGGPPVRPQGPPSWPPPDGEVEQALRTAFQDGTWGKYHGGNVERLESRLAEYFQVPHVITCASGTYAVELGLRALQVAPQDEVILPAYDFAGNFLNVHALGARPVLVDIRSDSGSLDGDLLDASFTPTTRAIVASHLHGGVADMDTIRAFAGRHGVAVLEDAAQCPGAELSGRKLGSIGDAGVLSFGGSKLLSAGRGGALMTHRADVYQRAKLHSQRGNRVCPLSELQAAVLLPQLDMLDARNARREENVRRLVDMLRMIPALKPFATPDANSKSAYYKLGFWYDAKAFGLPRTSFVEAMRAEGIAFDEGFQALQKGRSPSRYRAGSTLVQAERAHDQVVVLHHPILLSGDQELEEIVTAVQKTYANADRLREWSRR